jgi:glycosyltransferase involved in cell wall biosynthesis
MRIAIITNSNPPGLPSLGGTGRVVEIEKEMLEKEGHEVCVFSARPFFYSLNQCSALSRLLFHLADLFPSFILRREVRAFDPQIIYTHNLTGCGFSTPRGILRSGTKWIHKLHDVQLFEPSGQIRVHESFSSLHVVWRRAWALLRRIAMGQPDIVISPTRWLLDEHRRYGFFTHADCRVIPNPSPVQVPCHPDRRVREERRDPFEAIPRPASRDRDGVARDDDQRKHDLIFVGRLDEDKGIDLVIAAWERLRPRGVSLVLVGGGSWEDRLRERHDPLLIVRGALPAEGVMEALSQSRVLVFASRILENQPTVILEALAAGCQVVATDVGGVRETVGERGTVVSAEDVDALVTALERALAGFAPNPASFDTQEISSSDFLAVFQTRA